jgi:uncharacterized protein (TIRG00374 family)
VLIRRWSTSGIARASIALALTALIVWRADPSVVAAAAAAAAGSWLLVAVGLVVIDRALMAYRWVVLVRVFESSERVPLSAILRVFFLSTFVGTFLPASVGGDAVRAYGLTRANARGAASLASVLMDRLLGVVSLLIVTLAGLVFASELMTDSGLRMAVVAVAIASAAAVLTIYSERAAAVVGLLLAFMPTPAARRRGDELVQAIRAYASRHGALANVLAGSVAVQLLRILQAYALGRSLGLVAPFTAYFAFVPIILLVMLLPITIYGLGTSQLAFAALFARADVAAGDAVALSLLFVALGLVGNLPGAFLYAARPRQEPPAEATG